MTDREEINYERDRPVEILGKWGGERIQAQFMRDGELMLTIGDHYAPDDTILMNKETTDNLLRFIGTREPLEERKETDHEEIKFQQDEEREVREATAFARFINRRKELPLPPPDDVKRYFLDGYRDGRRDAFTEYREEARLAEEKRRLVEEEAKFQAAFNLEFDSGDEGTKRSIAMHYFRAGYKVNRNE